MQTTTVQRKAHIPVNSASAVKRLHNVLADTGLRPPGWRFCVAHASTGRHLDRLVVSLPLNHFDEGGSWYATLCEHLPWTCRVTLVPEAGRIEIEPKR